MKQVTTTTVCDLSGDEADETLEFGLAGKAFEVDLTKAHADALREILEDYVKVARPMGKMAIGSNGSPRRSTGASTQGREQTQAVRTWARNNGMSVSDRGRISAEVQTAFDAAHQPATVG